MKRLEYYAASEITIQKVYLLFYEMLRQHTWVPIIKIQTRLLSLDNRRIAAAYCIIMRSAL